MGVHVRRTRENSDIEVWSRFVYSYLTNECGLGNNFESCWHQPLRFFKAWLQTGYMKTFFYSRSIFFMLLLFGSHKKSADINIGNAW